MFNKLTRKVCTVFFSLVTLDSAEIARSCIHIHCTCARNMAVSKALQREWGVRVGGKTEVPSKCGGQLWRLMFNVLEGFQGGGHQLTKVR